FLDTLCRRRVGLAAYVTTRRDRAPHGRRDRQAPRRQEGGRGARRGRRARSGASRRRRQHRGRGAPGSRRAAAPPRPREDDQGVRRRLSSAAREGEGEAGARAGIHPLMRMSRERIFHLADLIVKELDATEGVRIKAADEVRPEIIRVLSEEAKFEESV